MLGADPFREHVDDRGKNYEVTLKEFVDAELENDAVHGAAFRAMRLRPPELVKLSVKETAAYLGVDVRTIRRRQAAGEMPHRFKVGREKRYRLLDIQELKAASEVTVAQDAPKHDPVI